MFTEKCYLEIPTIWNSRTKTYENRTGHIIRELKLFGYIQSGETPDNPYCIYTEHGTFRICSKEDMNSAHGFYDCKTNETLFLSLAALDEDTDAHQWFISEPGPERQPVWERFTEVPDHYMMINGRKATRQEIIEHFKQ